MDPSTGPDEYVRSLIMTNNARLVPLQDSSLVQRTPYDPTAFEYLPPMPERRRLLRTEEEEALFGASHDQDRSWIGTLWEGAVSWLFGNTKYEGVKERPDSTYRNSMSPHEKEDQFEELADMSQGNTWSMDGHTNPKVEYTTVQTESKGWSIWNLFSGWSSPNEESGKEEAPSKKSSAPARDTLLPVNSSTCREQQSQHRYVSPYARNPLHPDFISKPASARDSTSSLDTITPLLETRSHTSADQHRPIQAPSNPYKTLLDTLQRPIVTGTSDRGRLDSSSELSFTGHVGVFPQQQLQPPSTSSNKALPPPPLARSAFQEHLEEGTPHLSCAPLQPYDCTAENGQSGYHGHTSHPHPRDASRIVYIRMSDGR